MKTLRNLAVLFLLAGGALQAAPLADPQIGLSPGTFTFDVPKGGPNPPLQLLRITNIGTGQLDWTATVTNYGPAGVTGWLSLGQQGQSTITGQPKLSPGSSVNIDVLVNVGSLDGGTYTAKITVTGPAGVTTKTADVQMRVSAVPRMEATPTSFTFAAPQNGANPPSQTLTVKNTGSGILDWSFVVSQSWVQLSPAPQDLGAAASQDVEVQVLTGSLSPGLHQATITLSAPGVSNLVINVNFTINANPAIGLSPTTLTFDAPQGGPNPSAKQFTVKNDGGATLTWSASSNAAWLILNPTGGSLASGQSQVVTATVDVLTPTNPANLVESTYLATVTVTGLAPVTNSPQTLGVTLNVNSIATIGLNPQTLTFTLATDVAASSPAPVSITNTGSGTLNWSATNSVGWLAVSPGGGSLSALSSQPLQVTAIPFGLAPGVYTTNVQITAPGASNSPRNLAVELTVTASSLPTTAPAGQCGLLGLEMLALLALLRSLKSRGGSSCTSR